MAAYRRKRGQRIGPWKLVATLGRGGNAEVWRADRNDGVNAALKILYNTNPHQEPYKRFRAEVKVVESLRAQPGILPLIDSHIPERPTHQSPAWLAMPVAVPILKALGREPTLETVVEAVATISETLAALAGRYVFHRDIKPGNLYRYGESWVIGDFGLASYPDKEALTAKGKKLGPLFFLADEMIANPVEADPAPADVFALAKTLWVLATGQNFPPQGEQRTDVPPLTISGNVAHPRAYLLDSLIERATSHIPERRPTMNEVAAELRAWLAPPVETTIPRDLAALAARVTAVVQPLGRGEQAKEQRRALLSEQGSRIMRSLEQKIGPLADELARVVPGAGLSRGTIPLAACKPRGHNDAVVREGCCAVAEVQAVRVKLWSGMGIELPSDDDRLYIAAAHVIRPAVSERDADIPPPYQAPLHVIRIRSFEYRVVWWDHRWVPLNSAQQEQAIDLLFDGLVRHFPYALQWFTGTLEHTRKGSA
jgi:hypothetical protein